MANSLGRAIRTTRIACGLTQDQLGIRLGLRGKGQAVFRWEGGAISPRRRNLNNLIAVFKAANPQAAAAFVELVRPSKPAAPPPAPAPLTGAAALERAVYLAADELDLPARKVRAALLRLVKRLRAGQVTLEQSQPLLEAWVTEAS